MPPFKKLILVAMLSCGATAASAASVAEYNSPDRYDWWKYLQLLEKNVQQEMPAGSTVHGSDAQRMQLLRAVGSPLQRLGTARAMLGDSMGAIAAFDTFEQLTLYQQRKGQPHADDDARLAAATPRDAIHAIVEAASKRQIVILNESHHVPMHRAFAAALARELRKIGFDTLAVETFGTTPNAWPYIHEQTGYYSNEPVFGHFLREARQDGWAFVQYEEERADRGADDYPRQRELEQAENIQSRIFASRPNARVFIYVGYSHSVETPIANKREDDVRMASHVRRITGIDPLTIDQTVMYAHAAPGAEQASYQQAQAKSDSQRPFVLLGPGGQQEVFGAYRNGVDMQVIHPRYAAGASGRPGWYAMLPQLQPHRIPANLYPATGRKLITARATGADLHAVPYDAIVISADAPAPQLMLPPGSYTLLESL